MRAVASTDLVSRPHVYLNGRNPLVVSFGRSGNSTESIGTMDALDALTPGAPRLHITCNAKGALATRLSGDNQRAIIVGERTWGKGSVQNVIQMEDGDSALKLTTASYHRPSGVNIHRFKGMKPEDTWGVTPDKGYDIPFTAGEWREWDDDRSQRDILTPPGADPVKPTFEDRQLVAAVEYLEEQIMARRSGNAAEESPDETPGQSDPAPQPAAADK